MTTTTVEPKAVEPKRNGVAPKARVVEITPAKAKRYLAGNTHNRNVRPQVVTQLAGAMSRGEWVFNGEAIQIGSDGSILNGQHRLLAVLSSGHTITSVVVTGLPAATQETIDIGRARTVGDMLKLRGYTDVNVLGAAARLAWSYDNHRTMENWARNIPTPQQILAYVERNSDLSRHTPPAKSVADHGVALPVSWGTTLRFLFAREWDDEDAATFFLKLAYGDGLVSDDPIYKLRDMLIREASRTDRRFHPVQVGAFTIKAFNAWVLGEKPGYFRWAAGGSKPEDYPQVITKETA